MSAILVPVVSSLTVGIFWYFNAQTGHFGREHRRVALDPLTKGMTALIAMLVLVNTILLFA